MQLRLHQSVAGRALAWLRAPSCGKNSTHTLDPIQHQTHLSRMQVVAKVQEPKSQEASR